MSLKAQQVFIHFFGCACFLALPFIFRPGKWSEWSLFGDPRNIGDLIVYLLLIGFFYLNYYTLVPYYFFTQKYLNYCLLICGCFLLISFLPDLLIPFKPMRPPMDTHLPLPPPRGFFFLDKASRYFFIFMAVLLFSLLLKINSRWRLSEKEKLSTELSYLRSQINPHFLFNTLNSIYSLAVDRSDETANAVVKLSGMMRYVINDAGKNFVPLEQELEYINDYISFQKIRFGNNIPVSYAVTGDATNKLVAPLIIMSFVENAFKHGINAAEPSEIKIDITITDRELQLFVFNKKVTTQSTEKQSGIGIANTRKRLALLYPGRHTLVVDNNKESFHVRLQILFNG